MHQHLWISLILITLLASKLLKTNAKPSDVDILDNYQISNITSLKVTEFEGTIRYAFGKRVKYDRLVSQNTDTNSWLSIQNVTFILQYPSSTARGDIVTFVEILVQQSSNIGTARVIAGGIGNRFIVTIVESNNTYWFNYSTHIYGI